MTEVLADGVIRVGVESDAGAELARIEAEYHAAMKSIGREKAEINVKANTKDAERQLADVGKAVKKTKSEIAALEAEERKLRKTEEELTSTQKAALQVAKSRLGTEQALQRSKANQVTAYRSVAQAIEKERKLAANLDKETSAATKKAVDGWKARAKVIEATGRAQEKLQKEGRQQAQAEAIDAARTAKVADDKAKAITRAQNDLQSMGRIQTQAAKMDADRTTAQIKNAEKLAQAERRAGLERAQTAEKSVRLQQAYGDAQRRLSDITKAGSRAHGSEKIRVDLDKAGVFAQMETIREALKLMGEKPIDQKINVKQTTGGRVKNFLGLGSDQKSAFAGLKDLSSKMKDARVNVGPLSTSLSGLAVLIGSLAPIVIGLVGALGSLVAVAGAALGGALGVGAAAMTGFGLAAAGIFMEVKPLAAQLVTAHKAVQAYNAAVVKYGEGSKQAKTAQKAMNETLKSLSPVAREAVKGFDFLKDSWHKLTDETASRDFGNIVGSSFKTASADMWTFAHGTNQVFDAVSKGWGKWMKQLASPEARDVMSHLMGNLASSLPNVMGSLGHLGAAFGRTMSSFSDALPGLSRGFSSWAKSIDGASKKSGGFSSGVKTMVSALQSVGHFAQQAAHWLMALFGPGVKPGIGFLDSMTASLKKNADAMQTVSGQKRLADFYGRSITTTKTLAGALQPLIAAFAKWGAAMTPVTVIALKMVTAFANLAHMVADIEPARMFLGFAVGVALISRLTRGMYEAGAAAGGLFKRLNSVIEAGASGKGFAGMKAALSGGAGAGAGMESAIAAGGSTAAAEMGGAIEAAGSAAAAEMAAGISGGSVAGAAENALGNAGAGAGAARAVEGEGEAAAKATAEMASGGVAAEGLAGGLEGVGAAASLAGGAVLAMGAGTAYLTYKILTGKTAVDANTKSMQIYGKASQAIQKIGVHLQGGLQQQHMALEQSNLSLKEAQKALAGTKKGTLEHRQALLDLHQAQIQDQNDQKAWMKSAQGVKNAAANRVIELQKTAEWTNKVAEATKRKAQQDLKVDVPGSKNAQNDQAIITAMSAMEAAAHDKVTNAIAQETTAAINLQRAHMDLPAALGKTYSALTKLARVNRTVATQVGVSYKSTADVQKVAPVAQKALTSGVKQTSVIRIIADSSSADQAIRRLNAATIRAKTVKFLENGGDKVIAFIENITGKKVPTKLVRMLATGHTTVAAIIGRLEGMKISPKTAKLIANDLASGKIGAVLAALALLHDKAITITTSHVDTYRNQAASSSGGKPVSRKAAGRGPGGTEKALIGEGRGPEYRVDPVGGRVDRYDGPTMVDLRPEEYVIPTEPRYKAKGASLWRDALKSMGILGYAKSRDPKKKTKPKTKAKTKKLSRATEIKLGGIPLDSIQTEYNTAKQAYDSTKGNRPKSNASKKAKSDHAATLSRRHRALLKAQKDLRTAKAFDNRLTILNAQISADGSHMDSDSTIAGSARSSAAQIATASADYKASQDDRRGKISTAIGVLNRAIDAVPGNKYAAYKAGLEEQLGSLTGTQFTNEDPVTDTTAAPKLGLSDYITAFKLDAPLNNLLLKQAMDSANGIDTTADTAALAAFYRNIVIPDVAKTGDVPALTDAYSALSGYTGGATSGPAALTSDQQAQLDQATGLQTYVASSQAANNITSSLLASSGDISGHFTSARAAASAGPSDYGTTVINVNTLHPGDPNTLAAIGAAATAGIGYQGAPTNNRSVVGI